MRSADLRDPHEARHRTCWPPPGTPRRLLTDRAIERDGRFVEWKSRRGFRAIGGPLIFASCIAILLGAYEQTGGTHFLLSIPEIAWELSLGIYLVVKGFKPSPILDDSRYSGPDESVQSSAAAAP